MSSGLESWMPVKGYEGYYMVSDRGRVINALTGKELRPGLASNGYLTVCLGYANDKNSRGRCTKSIPLHRVLAEAWIPNPYGKEEINHKDGNKLNNSLENLEWATYSENIKHAYRTKLRKAHSEKLSDDDVRYIRKVYKPWSTGPNGPVALAKRFNCTRSYIGLIARGQVRKGVKECP